MDNLPPTGSSPESEWKGLASTAWGFRFKLPPFYGSQGETATQKRHVNSSSLMPNGYRIF